MNDYVRQFTLSIRTLVVILLVFQVLIAFSIFNPWSQTLRMGGFFVLFIELVIIVFWCVPEFIFYWLIKRQSFKDCCYRFVDSLIQTLSLGNM